MENKKRFDNLDLIKAFGIFAVISLHFKLLSTDFINDGIAAYVQYIFRLILEGVPIFLTINGFLLLRKETIDIKKHIKKMVKMLAILLIWSFILGILGYYMLPHDVELTVEGLYYIIVGTTLGSNYTGVLWFIQFLLSVYLFYPAIWFIYKNNFVIFKYVFAVLTFFVPVMYTLYYLADFMAATTNWDLQYYNALLPYFNNFRLINDGWYLYYFCLGGMIWHYKDFLLEHKKAVCIVGFISWVVAVLFGTIISCCNHMTYNDAFNYQTFTMIGFIISLIIGTMSYTNAGKPGQKLLASIGQNTFGMYLCHFGFIYIFNNIWIVKGWEEKTLKFLVVFICSYLFAVIIKKIPVIKFIVEL